MTEKVEVQNIGVDAISLPGDQQRIDVDDEKIDELAASIKEHGLLNPINLRAMGDRYELIAGWCRLQAYKRLGLPTIPAIVLSVSDEEADVLRAHENEFRVAINPVELGIYYKRLQEKHGWDDARIAKAMHRSIPYVQGRIDLLGYPEYILEPLALGKLSLGAAAWLAKIENEVRRRQYVIWGVQGGISVNQAHSWYMHSQLSGMVQSPSELPVGETGEPKHEASMQAECMGCGKTDELGNFGMYYWHEDCLASYQESKGEPVAPHAAAPDGPHAGQ